MGQRANLVLIEDSTAYKLFYSHWCANTIPTDVFWGPDYAIPWILRQRPMEREKPESWLDEVWAEGGLVLDLPRKNLLLWGGEDLDFDIPLRRVYLDLLRQVWSGWTIRWAYQGMVDMADYVGVPREAVLSENRQPANKENLKFYPMPTNSEALTDVVFSMVLDDGTFHLFGLLNYGNYVGSYLWLGNRLLEEARRSSALEHTSLRETFAWKGIHVDVSQKQVSIWSAHPQPAIVERISPLWPEWEFLWLEDNFEFQVEHTRGKFTMKSRSNQELLIYLEKILLTASGRTDAKDAQNISLPLRREILDKAIAAWRGANEH